MAVCPDPVSTSSLMGSTRFWSLIPDLCVLVCIAAVLGWWHCSLTLQVWSSGSNCINLVGCACRHQWFQTQSVVEVAVLAKNMTKERVDIQIDKQHLRVVIRNPEGEQEYELELDLYDEVSCLHQSSSAARTACHDVQTVIQHVVISR